MVYAEFMHTAPIGSNFPILDSTREQKYETIEGKSNSTFFLLDPGVSSTVYRSRTMSSLLKMVHPRANTGRNLCWHFRTI
jgi:hypothetical protein